MPEFRYQEMFPVHEDQTRYRLLSDSYLVKTSFEEESVIKVFPEGLTELAETAFREVSHLLRTSHMEQLKKIIDDPESSENDRYVALEMIKNAVIAADYVFPMCQDTGTAIILGKKGHRVWTGFSDEEALSRGVFNAYTRNNLRYSQNAPLDMYREVNTKCNLPAQIDIHSVPGDAYHFLFMAKGGGSANKTFLFQETKAVLNPKVLVDYLKKKIKTLGTAACPPYHLAIAIGGTSAELNLKAVKLASAGYLDGLPEKGNDYGHAFRDHDLEKRLLEITRRLGIGAQFGGKYFCHDIRVIRMPRHGASCPVGIGVSCSADRNIKAKITEKGLFLEQLETDPAKFLPESSEDKSNAVQIDLNRPMDEIRNILAKYPVATRLLLSGRIVVARDIAHAKIYERLENGDGLPDYFKDHIVYYAGPAKTPSGYPSGSFGPTTAGRMDPYVPAFQKNGGSLVMLAKGNRSKSVTDSCKIHGGFYLGAIGGPAARIAKECITNVETIEYPELGMEAVFQITVKDFPAFIIVDDKGNDFFENLLV
ncbi:MAG: fumarate hydratase [Desulfobacterales bacterium]